MKITDVISESYGWPYTVPISNGKYTYTHVNLGIVRVETDEGLTGIGIGAGGDFARAIVQRLRPGIIGQDPFDVERIWNDMWQPKLVGRRGLTTRVISAIDIALWDLRGKATGQPLYKLLGGFSSRVPTYIAGGYYEEGKGLKELAQEMEGNLKLGARAVKMKVGAVPIEEDVERVRVVREAIGPGIKLMVDANNAYRYYEAIQLARRIEQYDVFWFEEPVAPDDYRGSAQVAAQTIIPIATGENEYTRYGFRDLIEHRAAAILNADAQVLGGVTEFMKVAAISQAYDLPIAPHGSQDVHVHLVAAIPNGLIVEYYAGKTDPLWDRKFKEPLTLSKDGFVEPPNRPGLGVEPDWEVLKPYRVG